MASTSLLICNEAFEISDGSDDVDEGIAGDDASDGAQQPNMHVKRTYWLGTRNNPTPEFVGSIKAFRSIYTAIGWENAPTTGTEHLHWVFRLGRGHQKTMSQMKAAFPGANFNFFESPLYATKVNYFKRKCYEFWENGTEGPTARRGRISAQASGQADAHAHYRDLAEAGRSREIPADIYCRYFNFFERCERVGLNDRAKEAAEELLVQHDLYEWQILLWLDLQEEPDPWHIVWCYDPEGHAGKSHFCDWYEANHPDSQVVTPGKSADMAYALTPMKRVYLFDVPRIVGDKVAWGFIEQLKNGRIFSSKYNSTNIRMPKPHVVVLSNSEPPITSDTTGFSPNRVTLIRLSTPLWY